jgi:hypothetical protein
MAGAIDVVIDEWPGTLHGVTQTRGPRAWWRRRQSLRATARDLRHEFRGMADGVRFGVKAHGGRRLELTVWPEAGLDNFIESAHDPASVEHARTEFRRIVELYAAGKRPPFE